ncbi:MAG TPA: hypothetical protein VD793_10345 [Gemmatimonadales bacterium]|nr:hypothetical protein [Gemmatimonadales bacterium]
MHGTVIHIAVPECVMTQVHEATACGIVRARRRCGEEADTAMQRLHQAEREWQQQHPA